MKAGYKKNRKKASKHAQKAAAATANTPTGDGDQTAMEVEVATEEAGPPISAKARKRRQLMEKKSLKAKLVTLKKTKMSVRAGMARGLQGATNQTNNQLSQHILKLAQEQEGMAKKGGKSKKKGKAAGGLPTDVEMAA